MLFRELDSEAQPALMSNYAKDAKLCIVSSPEGPSDQIVTQGCSAAAMFEEKSEEEP